MKYFDTHCHLNIEPLKSNIENIIDECKDFIINNIGTDIENCWVATQQAQQYKNVYASIGIHPCDTNVDINFAEQELEKMLVNNKKIIAIGETGLDYYHAPFDIEKQKEFLFMHIKLAKKYSLPLVLHVRDNGNNYAHNDVVQIVKENCDGLKVLIHCFDANKDIAEQYVDLGCYIAFGGKITMKNDYLAESLKIIPENRIVSETDAPFLTPLNFKINKASFNKPFYMLETIKKINEIKSKDLTNIMFENSCELFNIKNI